MLVLTDVSVFPAKGEGVAATVVPYAVVVPYSKVTVTSVRLGFTLPWSTALVSVTALAAWVVARAAGGEAMKATLWRDDGPRKLPANRSPVLSTAVLTSTGLLREVVPGLLIPSRPSVLSPQVAVVPSVKCMRRKTSPPWRELMVLPEVTPVRGTTTAVDWEVVLPRPS
jgi:hypothetical protein